MRPLSGITTSKLSVKIEQTLLKSCTIVLLMKWLTNCSIVNTELKMSKANKRKNNKLKENLLEPRIRFISVPKNL